MNERILFVERELNRISKIVKLEYYNPIMVLNLSNKKNKKEIKNDKEEQIKQIKKSYKTIVRLIHPDKAWNVDRFCEAFNVVNISYKILLDDDKRNICINALQNEELLEKIYKYKEENNEHENNEHENNEHENNKNDMKNKNKINTQSLVIWNPSTIVLKQSNNTQNEKIKVTVNIAIDGAEHTKNKCKSKSDKHQKGLKQRVTQKKNAENRIINHDYSFTNKVVKENNKKIKNEIKYTCIDDIK